MLWLNLQDYWMTTENCGPALFRHALSWIGHGVIRAENGPHSSTGITLLLQLCLFCAALSFHCERREKYFVFSSYSKSQKHCLRASESGGRGEGRCFPRL